MQPRAARPDLLRNRSIKTGPHTRVARRVALGLLLIGCGCGSTSTAIGSSPNTDSVVTSASATASAASSAVPNHLSTIEQISAALTTRFPACQLVEQTTAPPDSVAATPQMSPLVDGVENGLSFGPDFNVHDYACSTGFIIINVAVFDSAEARLGGVSYLGTTERPKMASGGVTEVALAWNDTDDWMSWVEKMDQPMPAPTEAVGMTLFEVAQSLGGTSKSLKV